MEYENSKIIKQFISKDEQLELVKFVNTLSYQSSISNKHIKEVAVKLNGNSFMFDITKTEISNHLSTFQSNSNIIDIQLPEIIYSIIDRISNTLNINKDNIFLQIISMNSGGSIHPHYDSSVDGYINYKCNISVVSNNYNLYVDKDTMNIDELDLYCFESSLYKHWTDKFSSERVLLSFGFALEYEDLDRDINDYRVRLSKRINHYFQN